MKSKFVSFITLALLAAGMVFAQSSGQSTMDSQTGSSTAAAAQTGGPAEIPPARDGETQTGKSADPNQEMPGAMGTATDPESNPKGETPATGEWNGPKGPDNAAHPGADPAMAPPTSDGTEKSTTPKSNDSQQSGKPSYAKPITSTDSTDAPSQNSTDSGTASPK